MQVALYLPLLLLHFVAETESEQHERISAAHMFTMLCFKSEESTQNNGHFLQIETWQECDSVFLLVWLGFGLAC